MCYRSKVRDHLTFFQTVYTRRVRFSEILVRKRSNDTVGTTKLLQSFAWRKGTRNRPRVVIFSFNCRSLTVHLNIYSFSFCCVYEYSDASGIDKICCSESRTSRHHCVSSTRATVSKNIPQVPMKIKPVWPNFLPPYPIRCTLLVARFPPEETTRARFLRNSPSRKHTLRIYRFHTVERIFSSVVRYVPNAFAVTSVTVDRTPSYVTQEGDNCIKLLAVSSRCYPH